MIDTGERFNFGMLKVKIVSPKINKTDIFSVAYLSLIQSAKRIYQQVAVTIYGF